MRKPSSKASLIWPGFLLLANLVYLAYELAFNSRIVDSATGEFSAALIDGLEVQGRALSGIGLSLLLWRFIPSNKLSVARFFAVALSIFAIAFCSMFYGQKELIEHLVSKADGEARLDAQYLSILKRGIASNAIQLDDIHIPESELDSPGTKAFINIIGAMIYSSDIFIEHIKLNTDQIIDNLATNESLQKLPSAYQKYSVLGDDLEARYQDYAKASEKYVSSTNEAKSEALARVSDLYEELASNWKAEQDKLDKNEKIRKSLEIKRGISDYFESKEKCLEREKYNQRCQIKLEEVYRDKVIHEVGRYVAPDYWCYPPAEVRLIKTIRGKARSVVEFSQDCTTMSREYLENKLIALMGGSNTFSEFLSLPEVVRAVNDRLISDGISTEPSWKLNDRASLENAFTQKAQSDVHEIFKGRITEQIGYYLEPGLDAKDFLGTPQIQAELRDALRLENSSQVRVNWTPEEFHQTVLKPQYVKEYNAKKRELIAKSNELEDGGPRGEEGRQYYRSIIVPPIAMGFSLFFGLLNLFALVAAILGLAGTPLILSKVVAYGAGGVVFFVYPLLQPSNVVTSRAFIYFQQQMDRSFPTMASSAAKWVVDAQPILYPIGNTVAGLVGQPALETLLAGPAEPDNKHQTIINEETLIKVVQHPQSPEPKNIMKQSHLLDTTNPIDQTNLKLVKQGGETKGNNYPFSLQRLKTTLKDGDGIAVDLMPLGSGLGTNYVVYDQPIVGSNICIRGRRQLDSLYYLKHSDWVSSTHGACSVALEMTQNLPSLSRYLQSISRELSIDQKAVFTLHDSLTGEVRCNSVHSLLNEVQRFIPDREVSFNTTSQNVLGCYQSYPRTIQFGYQFPAYEAGKSFPEKVDHSLLSRKEWQRLNALEQGKAHGVDSIKIEALQPIIEGHPSINFIAIDKRHRSKEITRHTNEIGIALVQFDLEYMYLPPLMGLQRNGR